MKRKRKSPARIPTIKAPRVLRTSKASRTAAAQAPRVRKGGETIGLRVAPDFRPGRVRLARSRGRGDPMSFELIRWLDDVAKGRR